MSELVVQSFLPEVLNSEILYYEFEIDQYKILRESPRKVEFYIKALIKKAFEKGLKYHETIESDYAKRKWIRFYWEDPKNLLT